MNASLQRKLTWRDADGTEHVEEQQALIARTDSLIVLGEAGMGKTTLLNALGEQIGRKPCTAR